MTLEQRLNIAYKKGLFRASTDNETLYNNETFISSSAVKIDSIWTDSESIPENNPLLQDYYASRTEWNNIIKKYNKVQLQLIPGTTYAYYHPDIFDIINESVGIEYRPILWYKDLFTQDYEHEIVLGRNNWHFDYESGILFFPNNSIPKEIQHNPESYSPAITCYQYIGKKGEFSFIKGFQGTQGLQGPQGSIGSINDKTITFKGFYDSNVTYKKYDCVLYNNDSYILLNDSSININPLQNIWKKITLTENSGYVSPQGTIYVSTTFSTNYPYFENLNEAITYINNSNINDWNIICDGGNHTITLPIIIQGKNVNLYVQSEGIITGNSIRIIPYNVNSSLNIFGGTFNSVSMSIVNSVFTNQNTKFINCSIIQSYNTAYPPTSYIDVPLSLNFKNSAISTCYIKITNNCIIKECYIDQSNIIWNGVYSDSNVIFQNDVLNATIINYMFDVSTTFYKKILFDNVIFKSTNSSLSKCGLTDDASSNGFTPNWIILKDCTLIDYNCVLQLTKNYYNLMLLGTNTIINSTLNISIFNIVGNYPLFTNIFDPEQTRYIYDFSRKFNLPL